MRQELSKWGIKAVAIHPSGFRTGWCLTFRDVLSASRPWSSAVSNRALSDPQESDILSHSLCGLWKLSSVVFFFCERCSLQLYTLPASPLLGRAIFALRQGGFQAVAPALLELTNGAAWWVQFECYGPLVLPGSFRCPHHSSLARYQSSLYWAALSCMAVAAAIPAILLACCQYPLIFPLHSFPVGSCCFLSQILLLLQQSLSRFQIHLLLHMPSQHPMPAQSIFFMAM